MSGQTVRDQLRMIHASRRASRHIEADEYERNLANGWVELENNLEAAEARVAALTQAAEAAREWYEADDLDPDYGKKWQRFVAGVESLPPSSDLGGG